eukprot:724785-Amorphochlora_amoeboformis.AAC.2
MPQRKAGDFFLLSGDPKRPRGIYFHGTGGGREEFKALARDNKEAKSTVKIGGKEVKLYGDHDFARIRKRKGVPEDFLSSFKFEDLSDGGGKGGSPIAFLSNGYIVKELAEISSPTPGRSRGAVRDARKLVLVGGKQGAITACSVPSSLRGFREVRNNHGTSD